MKPATAKLKLLDGRELSASDFAQVGDPNNPDTWNYPIYDEAQTRLSISQLLSDRMEPEQRDAIAQKLLDAAEQFGIGNDEPIIGGLKDLVEQQLAAASEGSARAEFTRQKMDGRKTLMSSSRFVRYAGGRASVGLESRDKVQLASDAMFGVKQSTQHVYAASFRSRAISGNVAPFRGLRDMYQTITGDEGCEELTRGGLFKVSESIATTDFPNVLLNSMTKKLIQDYQEYNFLPQLEKLYVPATLGDYKTQDRVRMGYLSDLPTVAEAGPYTELTKPTDEKISYAPVKKGGVLTVSEETIRNDDLGKLMQFPTRMARAGRHTLASFVTNFFINNPNYDADGVAWFNAAHSNTGTVALSSAELDVRKIALAKQAEKDSGNRLALPLDWIMVPVDLEPTARQINRNDDGTNNWYLKFGQNDENIIVNPLLTDVTDWYGGTFQAPFLEVGFLDGYQMPQIYLANDPTQGTQFTNDQIQFKVKFVFGGDIIDFRGAFKEVVAG